MKWEKRWREDGGGEAGGRCRGETGQRPRKVAAKSAAVVIKIGGKGGEMVDGVWRETRANTVGLGKKYNVRAVL